MVQSIDETSSWLSLLGAKDSDLEGEIARQAAVALAKKNFTQDDVSYIAKLDLSIVDGTLAVSGDRLERLRKLCRLWETDFRASPITSHRRFIGPLIVAAKRALYPMVKIVMREPMRQQRDFNAAAVCLLAELCNDLAEERKP